MSKVFPTLRHNSCRSSLAACVASVFALCAPAAMANTWTVNSCAEGSSGNILTKTGTLRFAAANAPDGADIDMGSLGCSLISLTTGAINLPQNNLNILGPGVNSLAVRGAFGDRVLNHTGSGTLTISDLSVVEGYLVNSAGFAVGGCIESSGYLKLVRASVSGCSAVTDTGVAIAGGAYASTGLYLLHSNVTGNVARARTTGFSKGGGGYSRGELFVGDSTVATNSARASDGSHAAVGGLLIAGSAFINASTISGNASDGYFGGLKFYNDRDYASNIVTVLNSTISGNSAGAQQGGIYANAGEVDIYNSTIAFNTAATGSAYLAPGLTIAAYAPATAVTLQSSILSNNTYAGTESDLIVSLNPVTIGGGNNLIRNAAASVPGDTLHSCPLLGPLRNNGGVTRTHALLSHSPAIDAGNNVAGTNFDQRSSAADNGMASYLRISGLKPDIGAYEAQQDDIVFNGAFDGCPALQ